MRSESMVRLAIYIRVSSQEQVSGYSLDAQEDACRKWAAEQGHEVARVFVEPGHSARTDQRPEFQKMIQIVKVGIIDAILVHKIDRFARNLLDFLLHRNELEKAGKWLFSATEPFLNDDSPENRMVSGIVGSVAEYYSANLSREVKKGLTQAARSGRFPSGRLTLGYIRDEKKNIIFDPERSEIVRSSFYEFATSRYTLRSWADRAYELGLRSLSGKKVPPSTWQGIFRNIFYTGLFVWKGETFKGDHPPLVDEDTFQKVQDILTSKNTGGAKKRHFWLLSDLILSGVYYTKMTGDNHGENAYYRAKGSGPEHSVRADFLEMRVIALLGQITGEIKHGREHWRWAIAVSDTLADVWKMIDKKEDQREFLRLVFPHNGIVVDRGGFVVEYHLHKGFESL